MPRCHIEYDPDEHDPDTAQLADTVRRLLNAQKDGQLVEAVRLVGVIERAAEQVAARTLLAADAAHGGPADLQCLIEAYGRGDAAVRSRLNTTQEGAPRRTTHTVAGCRVRPGDVVTDPTGNCAELGAVTELRRAGAYWIATTESGRQLAFLPFDLVTVDRSKQEAG